MFCRDDKLILLFTPPFDDGPLQPGYIKGYLPGIRENGGQYTHAATWVVQALAMLKRGDKAVELFDLLNPIHHADTPEQVQQYRVEPYVVAADVYSATAAHRPWRLDVVHRLGELVLSRRPGVDPRLPPQGHPAGTGPLHPRRLGRL